MSHLGGGLEDWQEDSGGRQDDSGGRQEDRVKDSG